MRPRVRINLSIRIGAAVCIGILSDVRQGDQEGDLPAIFPFSDCSAGVLFQVAETSLRFLPNGNEYQRRSLCGK